MAGEITGIKSSRSPDGRIRTERYEKNGFRFCAADPVAGGTLITEFNPKGEVLAQTFFKGRDIVADLCTYLEVEKLELIDVANHDPVMMNAKCEKCGNLGLARELDRLQTRTIKEVPVLPIFLCAKCNERHYTLTEEYISRLVEANKHLFEPEELMEIDTNQEATINTIREYIIRIFASKKISRAKVV